MSNQNIKDRFYGVNDPVADKLVKRYQENSKEEKIQAGIAKNPDVDDEKPVAPKSHPTPGLPPGKPIKPLSTFACSNANHLCHL